MLTMCKRCVCTRQLSSWSLTSGHPTWWMMILRRPFSKVARWSLPSTMACQDLWTHTVRSTLPPTKFQILRTKTTTFSCVYTYLTPRPFQRRCAELISGCTTMPCIALPGLPTSSTNITIFSTPRSFGMNAQGTTPLSCPIRVPTHSGRERRFCKSLTLI